MDSLKSPNQHEIGVPSITHEIQNDTAQANWNRPWEAASDAVPGNHANSLRPRYSNSHYFFP